MPCTGGESGGIEEYWTDNMDWCNEFELADRPEESPRSPVELVRFLCSLLASTDIRYAQEQMTGRQFRRFLRHRRKFYLQYWNEYRALIRARLTAKYGQIKATQKYSELAPFLRESAAVSQSLFRLRMCSVLCRRRAVEGIARRATDRIQRALSSPALEFTAV